MAWFDKQGFDRSRVNIGLPYYSFNYTDNAASPTHPGEKVVNEPTWGTLSALCPNAAPEQHLCRGIAYCGKAMNEAIGRAVREEGFRGVFPWAANYDSVEHNNSLARWLRKGLRGKTDDTVRSTSRRRLEPADGKVLHMAGTSADLTPGPVHSLLRPHQAPQHQR